MTLVAQEIPKVGLVMEEARVVRWCKNVGDTVVAGEPLLEVETEKAVVEIEAVATGQLTQILVQPGQEVKVGEQVAWIESAAGSRPAATGSTGTTPADLPATPAASVGARTLITPVARKLMAEQGLDPETITGTGPRGRIQLKDVHRSLEAPRAPQSGAQALSPMRRALARAMALSVATVPQFTVARSVEWTVLLALRAELSAKIRDASPSLSLNDFLLQAVARALMDYPAMNATFADAADSSVASVVPASGAHIGMVLAVADGVLVPVIHDVERLGLAQIARRRQDCVERGLKGQLKRSEADGATISISNLGAQGPDRFTAIINPPQSAILAVGRQRDCVVARDGAIVVRPQSDLTLTVDHRVADGRLASQFLAHLVAILEGRDWRLE